MSVLVLMILASLQIQLSITTPVWAPYVNEALFKSLSSNTERHSITDCLRHDKYQCNRVEPGRVTEPCGYIHLQSASVQSAVQFSWTILSPPDVWLEMTILELQSPFSLPHCPAGYIAIQAPLLQAEKRLCGNQPVTTIHIQKIMTIHAKFKQSFRLILMRAVYQFENKPVYSDNLAQAGVVNREFDQSFCDEMDDLNDIHCYIPPGHIPVLRYSDVSIVRSIHILANLALNDLIHLTVEKTPCDYIVYDGPGTLSPILHESGIQPKSWTSKAVVQTYIELHCSVDRSGNTTVYYSEIPTSFSSLMKPRYHDENHKSYLCGNEFIKIRPLTLSARRQIKIDSSPGRNVLCVIRVFGTYTVELDMDFHGPSHFYTEQNSSSCQFGGFVVKPFMKSLRWSGLKAYGAAICESYSTRDGLYFNTRHRNSLYTMTVQFYSGYTSGSVLLTVKGVTRVSNDDNYILDRFTRGLSCVEGQNLCSFGRNISSDLEIRAVGDEVKDSGIYQMNMQYPGYSAYPYYGEFADHTTFIFYFQLGERTATSRLGPISVRCFHQCFGTTKCTSKLEYTQGSDMTFEGHEEIKNDSYAHLDLFIQYAKYIRYEIIIVDTQQFVFNVSYTKDQTCGALKTADRMKIIAHNCKHVYVPMNGSNHAQFQTQLMQDLTIKLNSECPIAKCVTLNITVQDEINGIGYEWRRTNLTDKAIVVKMFGFVNVSWNIDTMCRASLLTKCILSIDVNYPFEELMFNFYLVSKNSHISTDTIKYNPPGNYEELAFRKVVNTSWMESFEMCQRTGGHLPFLKDESNNDLLNQIVYPFLLGTLEPLNQPSMGDITFLGLMRKNGSFVWLDGTPLTNYHFWNVPDIYNHFPRPYDMRSSIRQHWFGFSKTSELQEVNQHLRRFQPQTEHECVGMFANPEVSHWVTIPCDVLIPTRLMCHLPKLSVRPMLKQHCLSNVIVTGHTCLKPIVDDESCDEIHVKENPEDSLSGFVHGVLNNMNISSQYLPLVDHQVLMLTASNVTRVCSITLPTGPCPDDNFQCNDLSCIPHGKRCNNIADCLVGEDEQGCNVTCRKPSVWLDTDCVTNCTWPLCVCVGDHFQCESGGCVNVAGLCDGYNNCQDGSDERHCGATLCAETEVMCADGRWCIPAQQWFDGVEDCMDASDEWPPSEGEPCPGFLCPSGQCIPSSRHIDGFPDCEDSADEQEYIRRVAGGESHFLCEDPDALPCDGSSKQCFYESNRCVYDTDRHGVIYFCRRADHLVHCKENECRDMFKCPSSYCVSFSKVCNGVLDCQDGADEADCPITACPNMFHCRPEGLCLHPTEVCDGIIQCRLSGDDEKYCRSLKCSGWECISNETNGVDLSLVPYHIRLVDMSFQGVEHIKSTEHSKHTGTVSLSLSHNRISLLPALVFQNCPRLAFLYINANKLIQIVPLAFRGFYHLQILDLSDNLLTSLAAEDFHNIFSLSSLDISGNNLESVIPSVFDDVAITQRVYQTDGRVCCMLPSNVQCFSKWPQDETTDTYDCPDRVSQYIVIYSSFGLIVFVLAPNGYSIVSLIHDKRKRAMLNLSIADSGFALYLLILMLSHFFYTSGSPTFVFEWPASLPCILASLLMSLSSVVSLLTLGLIALQSCVLIMFPFARFIHDTTWRILLCFWALTFTYTLLPLSIMYYFDADVRAMSHTCLMLPLFEGDELYAYVTQLSIVAIMYVVYIALCAATYGAVQRSNKSIAVNKKVLLSRRKLVNNMITVLVLNTCYYLPLIIVDIVPLLGFQTPQIIMAILVAIVFPMPKISNPLIYNVIKLIEKMRTKKKERINK